MGRSPPRVAEQHSNGVQVLKEGDGEDVIDQVRGTLAIRWPTQRGHTARPLHENGTSRPSPERPNVEARNPAGARAATQEPAKLFFDERGSPSPSWARAPSVEDLDVVRHDLVGPNHGPNPHVPRLFGWANRLLMVAYGVWLMVAAWPFAH